ncbi:MAG TPA: DNA helicase RecG, partial [Firmicutes bacterium]|nr:DNA helicase RecG [Bacillota bacterium]
RIQGWCLLFGEPRTPQGQRRMAAFARLNDGLALAEADLELRGPGEFFGTRQAGLPELRLPLAEVFGNGRLVEEARQAALGLLHRDPELTLATHRGLREVLRRRFAALVDETEECLCG